MNFLPKGYKLPKSTSDYFRFEDGSNKFRILKSPIVGWSWWTEEEDGKKVPHRVYTFNDVPSEYRPEARHFWALIVMNHNTDDINILEITQKSIQAGIKALTDDEDWGVPYDYDINVTRTGEKLETKYTVTPSPKKKLDLHIDLQHKADNIRLEALYDGEDPFDGLKDRTKDNSAYENVKKTGNVMGVAS